jgi:hypothetical protein
MTESTKLIDIRELALSAGEIHGRLVHEITAFYKLPRNDRMKRNREAIEQFRSNDLLTDAEAASLAAVFDTVHNVNLTDPQIAEQVSKINQELKDAKAGLVALTIAGIATDSTQAEAKRAEAEGRADQTGDGPIAAAAVDGAIDGAIVGAAAAVVLGTPSPALPIAGALGGAVAGAVAAWLLSD